ncbi:hypothetical protein SAMN02949497_4484 [Methylomagnum ishizawai]|uniref:Uncharacterized protein n=1 Tax=Methylomagnum ishizawai TaxID=1760988 RepID=A0A1Y6D341_9GAMM|nr:hypothetical protein [Methylomagnum ishizawai]SMF97067.1 hypothetical protein SAMN02949497_4484 [Methylomagnum ishizawai]
MKPKKERKKPRNVTLPDDTVKAAERIGGGNLSKGIRIAVAAYVDQSKASSP